MATPHVGAEPEDDRLHSARRVLAMLESLAARPEGATPKELSLALGLHLSTCYRLLNTLVATGYVTRHSSNGLFRLGPRVAYLHQGFLTALRPPLGAIPFVHALQSATGETAMLTRLEGDDAVITAVVAGSRPNPGPTGYVGLAVTAHCVTAGRALLAYLPTSHLETYLARRAADSNSPFPLTDPEGLRRELARIREAGYSLDLGSRPDVCCVAVPIVDRDGVVESSISTVAPCARFRREEKSLIDTAVAVARAIGSLQPHLGTRAEPSAADQDDAATQEKIKETIAAITEEMSRVGQSRVLGRPSP
jgi:IclR family acetate operon transcriptional repressor